MKKNIIAAGIVTAVSMASAMGVLMRGTAKKAVNRTADVMEEAGAKMKKLVK